MFATCPTDLELILYLNRPDNISQRVQSMELLAMSFSPSSCYLLFGSEDSPQPIAVQQTQCLISPQRERERGRDQSCTY